MKKKTASVHWEGQSKTGQGQISTETGALKSYPYDFASRLHSVNTILAPREVRISAGDAWLYGDVVLPPGFHGLVLFAHGSGSGRHSARNRQVAQHLQHAGIATLLFDLLTAQEEPWSAPGLRLRMWKDCGLTTR